MPVATPATTLFTAADLGAWLGTTVSDPKAAMVEQVVWGWLKPVLGLGTRPSTVPDEVFSWAIELGGIGHENPSGLSAKELGPAKLAFSLERRNEILEEAQGYGSVVSALSPRGSFPPAQCYPDPAW